MFLDVLGEHICSDGPVWSLKTVPATTTYASKSVAAGGGVVVAVSNQAGKPYAVYSTDAGVTWAAGSISGISGFPGGGYAPSYGNGYFFAMVNAVTGMYSPDGVSWTVNAIPSVIADNTGFALGRHFIIGLSDTNGIFYSTNGGVSWSASTLWDLYAGATTGLATDGTTAMFCGVDGTGGWAMTTTNGDIWTRKSAPWTGVSPNAVLCNGSRFVVFGNSNVTTDNGWYSDDAGTTWTAMSLVGAGIGTNVWRDGVYNSGVFLAVSDASVDVSISLDGITWTLAPNSMITGGATSVAATGTSYVAQLLGSRGNIRFGVC